MSLSLGNTWNFTPSQSTPSYESWVDGQANRVVTVFFDAAAFPQGTGQVSVTVNTANRTACEGFTRVGNYYSLQIAGANAQLSRSRVTLYTTSGVTNPAVLISDMNPNGWLPLSTKWTTGATNTAKAFMSGEATTKYYYLGDGPAI